ncbi:competence type IV pilus ATPase ComGA [Bacillus sp. SM2101]|uniref:competence type IV pilus ATPase ComGA n=1 Tax=Bacillus sp. SM2101 TaxID=2805366 RepID=UPI001BDF61C4|nr:competence type IV pilus ATPase ComGA [Bacillus sp. SM2101]
MPAIERIGDRLLTEAQHLGVSDIHFMPRKKDALIQFRLDNELTAKEMISKSTCERLIAHYKFLAGMDIGERRRPQNGALSMIINSKSLQLRLSTLPTINNESLVIRLLPSDSFYPLNFLTLFPNTTKKLISLLKHAHGLIIFTGPTGSGKTTTLYSLLHSSQHLINRNIITLEDPIEKRSDKVIQVQVNEKAGITYSNGLKAILRHDPDVIMVGEIRDAETAKIAVRASLTGHLVLTTMHTREAKGAIYRLLEFGVPLQDISQTLIAITAQRLVNIKCPFCTGECSRYCKTLRTYRRTSISEFVYGKVLTKMIDEAKGDSVDYSYKKMKDIISKAIALGFISTKEFDKWVYKDEIEK